MKKAIVQQIEQLKAKQNGYVGLLVYRYANLCIKADPFALLSVMVKVDDEMKKIEEVAQVAIHETYHFVVVPTYEEDLLAISKAVSMEHPEFKQEIKSFDGYAPEDPEGKYLFYTMPEVNKERHDAMIQAVDALYDECSQQMEKALSMCLAQIVPLMVDAAPEEIKRVQDHCQQIADYFGKIRDNNHDTKTKEVEDAYAEYQERQKEKKEKDDEQRQAAGNPFQMMQGGGFMATLLALVLSVFVAHAQPPCIDGIYYSFTGNTAEVINYGYNEYTGEVRIPDTVIYQFSKYAVTSIRTQTFYENTGLTKIIISDNVTTIGEEAFYGCSALTSLHLPAKLQQLESAVFMNCSALQTCTIPKGVTTIQQDAFRQCNAIQTLIIPNSVTSIRNAAFSGCTGLKDIMVSWPSNSAAIKPIAKGDNPFEYVTVSTINLHIPEADTATYRQTDPWMYFNLVPYSTPTPTAIDFTPFHSKNNSGEASKYLRDGTLLIQRDDRIYNAFGTRVK